MTPYETLPINIRCYIDECVIAFDAGGKRLAYLTFKAICEARKLSLTGITMLGLDIRNRLASLGLLQII